MLELHYSSILPASDTVPANLLHCGEKWNTVISWLDRELQRNMHHSVILGKVIQIRAQFMKKEKRAIGALCFLHEIRLFVFLQILEILHAIDISMESFSYVNIDIGFEFIPLCVVDWLSALVEDLAPVVYHMHSEVILVVLCLDPDPLTSRHLHLNQPFFIVSTVDAQEVARIFEEYNLHEILVIK